VHLGDRLLAIERIHEGILTVEEAARDLGVTVEDVIGWQQVHAFERMVSIDEMRAGGSSPEAQRLSKRAERLAELVADAERELRELHHELLQDVMASNEPFVNPPSSNKFA
jgi:molybdenum-dependent DNA-binding transcriptional regulator ModE